MPLEPVVIVSFYFPPQGGAGTQRFAKFAKWLPDFGYRPIVICSSPQTTVVSAPYQDPTLLAEIGDNTEVRPIAAPTRKPFAARLGRARFAVDEDDWVTEATRHTIEAVRSTGAKALIVTVSPYAAARLGHAVQKACQVPWILDLRDPWALDGWRVHPTALHAAIDRLRMRRALSRAGLIIASTPASRPVYARLGGRSENDVWTIPNGFDEADFDDTKPRTDSESFRVVHVGTLHDPGRTHSKSWRNWIRSPGRLINPLGRSGRYLFLALAALKRERPDLFSRVRLDLYGKVHPDHRAFAQELGIESAVNEMGYQDHRTAVQALVDADAVFVPLHGLPPREVPLIVPGKLYEAIASERFVIGAVPAGDASRLIETTGAGATCAPEDVAGMTRMLTGLLAAWSAGNPRGGARRKDLEMFTRRALTARLARALDRVSRRGPAVLGPADPWDETAIRMRSDTDPAESLPT